MAQPDSQRWTSVIFAVASLALAVGLVVALGGGSLHARAGNLRVSASTVPALYVMHHKTEPGRAYLVSRRASTVRRSRQSQPGKKRQLLSFDVPEAPGQLGYVALHKRHGVTVLLPIAAVPDWSCPLLHSFGAAKVPSWPLARVELRQLHVNRVYAGLYLFVELPHDRTTAQGGDGTLRQILAVTAKGASRMSTRFDDGMGTLIGRVILGKFPLRQRPPQTVRYLQHACGHPATQAFVLDGKAPWLARRSPLPFDLAELYTRAQGTPAAFVADTRFARWLQRPDPDGEAPRPAWTPRARAQLAALWQSYLPALAHALVLDAKVRDVPPPSAADVAKRLGAATALGLPLTEPKAEAAP